MRNETCFWVGTMTNLIKHFACTHENLSWKSSFLHRICLMQCSHLRNAPTHTTIPKRLLESIRDPFRIELMPWKVKRKKKRRRKREEEEEEETYFYKLYPNQRWLLNLWKSVLNILRFTEICFVDISNHKESWFHGGLVPTSWTT